MDHEIFPQTRIRERFLQTATLGTPSRQWRVDQRPHHHQRRADHDRGVHRLRLRRHAIGRRAQVARCAVAIAVDATVVRLVLVPALMARRSTSGTGGCRGGWTGCPPVDFREVAARRRHRRPGDHPRRHLRPWWLLAPDLVHGGQVGGAAQEPCPDTITVADLPLVRCAVVLAWAICSNGGQ